MLLLQRLYLYGLQDLMFHFPDKNQLLPANPKAGIARIPTIHINKVHDIPNDVVPPPLGISLPGLFPRYEKR